MTHAAFPAFSAFRVLRTISDCCAEKTGAE